MSLHVYPICEKVETVDKLIRRFRGGNAGERADADILKAIAADLRRRGDRPRNLALGELERALMAAKRSKTALGYEAGKLTDVAQKLIQYWPLVSQALEHYGEETAE